MSRLEQNRKEMSAWHWQGGLLTNGRVSLTIGDVFRLKDTAMLKEAKESGILDIVKSRNAFNSVFYGRATDGKEEDNAKSTVQSN